MLPSTCLLISFFFNDTATTEIYTLSLHDALPIFDEEEHRALEHADADETLALRVVAVDLGGHVRHPLLENLGGDEDRKSTRLNSSHSQISYAVFCLKKKKKKNRNNQCQTMSVQTQ